VTEGSTLRLPPCATIAQAMDSLSALLKGAGIAEHHMDARLLVCAAFQIAHIDMVLRPDKAGGPGDLARLEAFAKRRLSREPVTRILGTRGFWSLDLAVRPNVLDPRPDTEVVVEACLDALGSRKGEPISILDLGTGSGAIIAALLSECPQARGTAVDLSADAVAAARRNLADLGLNDRGIVLHQSWTSPLHGPFDLVVSNPPYIETGALCSLDPEVREFDPPIALDGGLDGLDAYRAIAERIRDWLKPDGVLVLEIGAAQAAAVITIFASFGAKFLGLRQDYAGHDRALVWTL